MSTPQRKINRLSPEPAHWQPLPIAPTPLIGRERALTELCVLLADPALRLLTLTGPGGVGKTRLAVEAALTVANQFPDGCVYVPLAAIADPRLVVSALAQALGLREIDDQPLQRRVQAALADRRVLILLDNFEQVIEAATLIPGLLAACPRITIVVTSRTVLNLASEQRYAVPPLSLPPRPEAAFTAAMLQHHAAVALFVGRARTVRPDFRLSDDNAQLIAEICYKLEGLPLAIELAAARLNLLSPEALNERLSNRLALLTSGPRDLPAHQQTLRRTIDWSYELLSEEEQRVFAQLSVFVGGWTLQAAEAIAGAHLLDLLASLIDKSMVYRFENDGADPRFGMLETIHEYAFEQLERRGLVDATRARHAAFYTALAEQAGPQLTGRAQQVWQNQLERVHDNLRAVLLWASAQGNWAIVARIAAAIWRFWHVHGHVSEGRQWLDLAVEHGGDLDIALRARVRTGAAWLANVQGDIGGAEAHFNEGLRLARDAGDNLGVGLSLSGLGRMAHLRGNAARAVTLYEESLLLLEAAGVIEEVAWTLIRLGIIALERNDFKRAEALFVESQAAFDSVGFDWGRTWAQTYLGDTALATGKHDQATVLYQSSLERFEQLGDRESATSLRAQLRAAQSSQHHTETAPVQEVVGQIDELTPREREVLRLVASGMTDAQVAASLHVSPRTVHAHLRSIYAKLGVSSRSAVTRLAVEKGII